MLGAQNIKDMPPIMGAKDFSFFAEAILGYFFLGMTNETKGHLESGHSPYYIVNEVSLPYGACDAPNSAPEGVSSEGVTLLTGTH